MRAEKTLHERDDAMLEEVRDGVDLGLHRLHHFAEVVARRARHQEGGVRECAATEVRRDADRARVRPATKST